MKPTLKRGAGIGRSKNWNGARLRDAREFQALSRPALGARLAARLKLHRVAPSTIAAWESGENRPARDVVVALEAILQTNLT